MQLWGGGAGGRRPPPCGMERPRPVELYAANRRNQVGEKGAWAKTWQELGKNLALQNPEHAMLPALGRGRRILKREALCRQPPLN